MASTRKRAALQISATKEQQIKETVHSHNLRHQRVTATTKNEPKPPPPKRKRKALGDITNDEKEKNKAKGGKRGSKGQTKKTQFISPIKAPQDFLNTSDEVTSSQDTYSSALDTLVSSQSTISSSQDSQNSCSACSDVEVEAELTCNERLSSEANDYVNIDDDFDPFFISEYAEEIFKYIRSREPTFKVDDYMPRQPHVTVHMRAVLVDWLVDVQESFEMCHETLYLAIKMVDLMLCKRIVSKDELQLVGVTAIFLAAKFEERVPPMMEDFLYICDDAYKKPELIQMEMDILRALDFELNFTLPYTYLRRYAKALRMEFGDDKYFTLTLARYVLEMSQMDYNYVAVPESKISAAAMLLAMKMNYFGKWTNTMVHYSTYTQEDLKDLVRRLNKSVKNHKFKSLQGIKDKYTHKIFQSVATVQPLDDADLV